MQTSPHDPRKSLSRRLLVSMVCPLAIVLSVVVGRTYFFALPARAYPVLSTAGWMGGNPKSPDSRPYRWLANGDLAYLVRNPQGRLQVWYQKMDEHGPSGAARPGSLVPPQISPYTFFPSPDEQWVAYLTVSQTWHYHTVLISADGKTTGAPALPDEIFSVWLPDRRSFLTMHAVPHPVLTVRHLDSLQTETIPSATISPRPIPMTTLAIGPNILIGGVFNASHGLGGAPDNYPNMTIRSFQASQPDVVQNTWQVAVPKEAESGVGSVSPDNKSILWTTFGSMRSPFQQWSDHLVPAWQNTTMWTERYFLSDLHGNNKRLLRNNVTGGSAGIPLTWTPDSKHLSFIYKNQLYLVPID